MLGRTIHSSMVKFFKDYYGITKFKVNAIQDNMVLAKYYKPLQ